MKFVRNIEGSLGKEYSEHPIFTQLDYYADFYDSLSFSIMGFVSMGTTAITNIDTYTYSSMKGTIESIKDVLRKGKINDAYSLLRKYYDSTVINVYASLYLQDNQNIENFIVYQIDNWLKGIETIPEYRIISKYIKDSPKLSAINNLLQRDDRYKKIRNRCNDHTHYNFYQHYLLNDNNIYNPNRTKYLAIFAKDIETIFIQHLIYTFYLNDHYMVSSDYMDSIEMGMQPEEDSQYWVAPFVQEVFNKIIKLKRYDLAEVIKQHTMMQLE
jgi:hypothetical protein